MSGKTKRRRNATNAPAVADQKSVQAQRAQIASEAELGMARERVAALERLLQTLRATARPEEWPALSSGYRLEIERMQGGILDYLVMGAPSALTQSR